METLQDILKYRFKDVGLLHKAITHSSVHPNVDANYERLEFLGDRVLGVAVASLLYQLFPKEPEGNLSQRFVGLVCKENGARAGYSGRTKCGIRGRRNLSLCLQPQNGTLVFYGTW